MFISVKCPKCGTEGECITIKVGTEDIWLDACYVCGTKLIENGKISETT